MCQVSYRQPRSLARPLISVYLYFKCFRYATTLDKICILVASFCSIFCGILFPLAMLYFGDVTGAIVEYAAAIHKAPTEDEKNQLIETLQHHIRMFGVQAAIIVVVIIAMLYLSVVLYSFSAVRQIYKMRISFLEKMFNQDIEWFDKNRTGDFATLFTQNISKIEDGIGEKIGLFLFSVTVFLTGIIVALYEGWKLAVVAMVSLPISTIIMMIITKIAAKYSKEEMEAYGEAGAVAEEVISSIKTVVAFDGQWKETKLYENHLIEAKCNNIKRCIFISINNFCLWFCIFACYSLTYWYGVHLIVNDRDLPSKERTYTPSSLVTIFFATLGAMWYFGLAAPLLEILATARAAAQKVFYILDSKPKINKIKDKGRKLYKFQNCIKFDEVYFSYPTRSDVKVLWAFDLQINIGETVALVGNSGCGKSTCVQLLQRFYDPNMGRITIDDIDIKDMNLRWLREKIAVVSQEPALFTTTIAENIRFGKEGALQEEIEIAAKKAKIHDFILTLPNGYDTVIGKMGGQLSGGQKQKLAIARALVRKPQILLLDEATSALDTSSEAEVQAALDSISRECTTIIVAHRLSTIRKAKKIVLISEGKVSEIGSHEELMAKGGLYLKLVNSQGLTDTKPYSEIQKIMRHVSSSMHQFITEKVDDENIDEKSNEDVQMNGVFTKVIKMCKPEWYLIAIGCISSVIKGGAYPINGWIFGAIIGILFLEEGDEMISENNTFCLYFLCLAFVIGGSTFLQLLTFGIAGEKLTLRTRIDTFRAVLRQEIGWFDKKENSVGAICARLADDATKMQGAAGIYIGTVLNLTATFIVTFAISFYYEWKLTLVLSIIFPLIFISVYLEQKFLRQDAIKNQVMLEKSSKLAIEAIGNIRTVVSLGCEQVFLDLFEKELLPYRAIANRKSHIRGLILGMARALMIASYLVGMTYGGKLIIDGAVEYGTIFKVCEIMSIGSWAIGNALAIPPNFQHGLNAAARIISLLERKPLVSNMVNALKHPWNEANVEYSDIFFSYPTRPSVSVLNGLNLNVMKGRTVALVGSSGCGKSTIIQLLERFYDPIGGEVIVDGEDTRKMDLKWLRSQLGIVSQEPTLFDRTIAENISYGAYDNDGTEMDRVMDAAKSANIHAFISTLPMGYQTKVGAKGTQLSGGQKQRIAIARALMRDPKILLLDEATSALDNESEKILQGALDVARRGRTCITIAHRLTTIQDADMICVLEKGVVAEMGNHQELLQMKGLYYDFYNLQSGQK
ncbi:unnamed protein product [Phaedon cochleariae]|uniref:ABC-type xenobiotic transporter n=1 Tax=Phaedon cochleariae TaxID=80249 RepID=A0A9N9SJ24_PHACE|nr:unnamed protein product [Phaedon cochleariae]